MNKQLLNTYDQGTYFLIFLMLNFLSLKIPKLLPLDIPNERSSHNRTIPRSGPILALFTLIYLLPIDFITKIICSGLTILGYIDDRLGLSASIKLLFQFLIVFVLFFYLKISFLYLIPVLAFINFVNFMDGLNGLVLAQTALISFAMTLLSPYVEYYLLLFIFLVTALVFNFPNPKFYSGDCTSLSIPLLLSIPILGDIPLTLIFLTASSILWIDPLLTLIKRLLRREKIYIAHKSHGYQLLNQLGLSHTKVTLIFALVTVLNCSSLFIFEKTEISFIASTLSTLVLWALINIATQRLNHREQ